MKNIGLLTLIAAIVIGYSSCKDDIEDAIDCTAESILLSFHAEVDTANPLLVHFTFINADTIDNKFTLDETIRWEFGDGNEVTTQSLETSHEYPDAGSYKAKAHYTLRKGSSSCSSYKEKTVDLQ